MGSDHPGNVWINLLQGVQEKYMKITGLLVECGKKWKIVRKILPNSAGNSAEKSEIVRENPK